MAYPRSAAPPRRLLPKVAKVIWAIVVLAISVVVGWLSPILFIDSSYSQYFALAAGAIASTSAVWWLVARKLGKRLSRLSIAARSCALATVLCLALLHGYRPPSEYKFLADRDHLPPLLHSINGLFETNYSFQADYDSFARTAKAELLQRGFAQQKTGDDSLAFVKSGADVGYVAYVILGPGQVNGTGHSPEGPEYKSNEDKRWVTVLTGGPDYLPAQIRQVIP